MKDLAAAASEGGARHDRLDALRGVAIVWMAAFHFAFDLDHFGFIDQNFYVDRLWTWQRIAIVSMFMFCVGLGQAVAVEQGQPWRRFWRRWVQVAGGAVLVSLGSAAMFPTSWISFGVLHCIAVALIVLRLTAGAGRALWLLGALAVVLPFVVQHPGFDHRWSNWLGLVTRKPVTEDYAPLLPWIGVMWWGLASGRWMLVRRPEWLRGALPSPFAPLATLGRWSLSFYLLHQPVLIGCVAAVAALRGVR